jgi:hypothetical protein
LPICLGHFVRLTSGDRQTGRIGIVDSDDLSEGRRRRRAGDPRLSPEDRAILRRLAKGVLVDEFQCALDQDLANDQLLGGSDFAVDG